MWIENRRVVASHGICVGPGMGLAGKETEAASGRLETVCVLIWEVVRGRVCMFVVI